MPRALIVGSSGGIGHALMQTCAPRYDTVGLSRSVDGLDITSEASVEIGAGPAQRRL